MQLLFQVTKKKNPAYVEIQRQAAGGAHGQSTFADGGSGGRRVGAVILVEQVHQWAGLGLHWWDGGSRDRLCAD